MVKFIYPYNHFKVMKKVIVMTIFVIIILIAVFSYFNAAEDEIGSPGDHIKDSQIITTENYVILDLNDAVLAEFTATGSMLPIFNEFSTGIEIKPEYENQIKTGDIIVYEKDREQIIHRVKYIKEENGEKIFVLQGDNDNFKEEIKFENIKYILVGVLY